jgi:hypothetical protein
VVIVSRMQKYLDFRLQLGFPAPFDPVGVSACLGVDEVLGMVHPCVLVVHVQKIVVVRKRVPLVRRDVRPELVADNVSPTLGKIISK